MAHIRLDALNEYAILSKIGEGSFSIVYKVRKIKTGKLYALKVMKDRFRTVDDVKQNMEIQVMDSLSNNDNAVKLYEIVFEPQKNRLSLVMDLMDCSLLDIISPESAKLSVNDCLRLIYQLLTALAQLHSIGYIHRDIKPENCLIKKDSMTLKLADFGSTRKPARNSSMTEYIATRWYRPPECLLTSGDYGSALDIWAVGCVFYELVTKKPLFPGSNAIDQLQKIHSIMGAPDRTALSRVHASDAAIKAIHKGKASRHSGLKAVLPNVSDDVIDLLQRLLAYVPEDRISAEEALKHEAFAFIQKLPPAVESAPPETQTISNKKNNVSRLDQNNNPNARNNHSRLQAIRTRNPRIFVPKNHNILPSKPQAMGIMNQNQPQLKLGIINYAISIKPKPQSVLYPTSHLPGINSRLK